MKITNAQARDLMTALSQLDGYDRVVGDRVVRELYQLGATRLTIAKMMNALRPSIEVVDEARKALIRECSGGREQITVNEEGWGRFCKAVDEMMKQETEVALELIPVAVLRLDVNPIPIAALAQLNELGLIGN